MWGAELPETGAAVLPLIKMTEKVYSALIAFSQTLSKSWGGSIFHSDIQGWENQSWKDLTECEESKPFLTIISQRNPADLRKHLRQNETIF